MQALTSNQIESLLSEDSDALMSFASSLAHSGESEKRKMAAELSQALRRAGRSGEAAHVAGELFEANPSADNLNLWFVAIVDEGDVGKIRRMSARVYEYLDRKDEKYDLHLFSTWLKAANRIEDDQMFNTVLARIPQDELRRNSYLAVQYLVYLNRQGLYEDMVSWYESLPDMTRASRHVRRLYALACSKLGWNPESTSAEEGEDLKSPQSDRADGGNHDHAPCCGKPGVRVFYSGESGTISAFELMRRCGIDVELMCCDGHEDGFSLDGIAVTREGRSVFVLVEGAGEDSDGRNMLLVCLGYLLASGREVHVISEKGGLLSRLFDLGWVPCGRIDASDRQWAVRFLDGLIESWSPIEEMTEEG